jgi:hypothetical protein
MAIIGTQNFHPGRLGNKIKIQTSEPLDMVALAGSTPDQPETLRELTTLLMQRIAGMLPPAHRGIYT